MASVNHFLSQPITLCSYATATQPQYQCQCWLMMAMLTENQWYCILFHAHHFPESIIMASGLFWLSLFHLLGLYRVHQASQLTNPKEICGHPALSCGPEGDLRGSLTPGAKQNPEISTLYPSLFLPAKQFLLIVTDALRTASQISWLHAFTPIPVNVISVVSC